MEPIVNCPINGHQRINRQASFAFAAGLNLEGISLANQTSPCEREIAELKRQVAINTCVVAELLNAIDRKREKDGDVSAKLLDLGTHLQQLLISMKVNGKVFSAKHT